MKSLKKALDLLQVLLTQEGELSLSDMAKAAGLNVSTVHQIVSYLRKRGYVVQDGRRGKYSLGYKFLEFSDVIIRNFSIGNLALPYMKELNKLTNEYVTLAVLYENTAAVISRVESNYDLRVTGKTEREVPLYCTGMGKVLLAYRPEDDWDRYFSNVTLLPFTSNTITESGRLKGHLQEIKRQGYAVDNQENVVGIINIAAPVWDRNGKVVAAVGVLGPTVRITEAKIGQIIMETKGCASQISRALGYEDSQ